jgi:molecular chaperone GrpE
MAQKKARGNSKGIDGGQTPPQPEGAVGQESAESEGREAPLDGPAGEQNSSAPDSESAAPEVAERVESPEDTETSAPKLTSEEIEILRQERDDFQERWLRSIAELDNLHKRQRRELSENRLFAVADFVRPLLEVLDDFERALQSMEMAGNAKQELQDFQAGVQLIHQRFLGILKEQGLQRIEALGQPFDPNLHEAIQQVEVDGVPAGQITEVVQNGYKLHDRLLRPSRVVVAK